MSVLPTQDNIQMTDAGLIGKTGSGVGLSERLTAAQVRSLLSVLTDVQIAAAYQPIGSYAAASHTHAQSDITGLVSALAGKADTSHTHTASAVTDFSEAVDDRVAALLTAGTNITIAYNDAANTLTIASTASGGSPGGSSGQIQFNSAGSFGGAAAAVYSTTGTHVAITATGATLIPLCVKGAASQSGNLFEAQNSSGTVLSGVNLSGNFFVQSGGQIQSSATNYLRLATFLTTLNASAEVELISDNSAANSVRFGNNNGGLSLRGIACTVYAFAGTALQITSGAGSGTNGAGQPFRIRAGASTGNATPQSILLQTTTAGASGSTAQTHRSVAELDGNTTSGETPLLLLDCAKGTLQRVSIGASDSGGTGFKVLRVPN